MTSLASVPEGVEQEFPLARLTTIRTGGPAELFARAGSLRRLERLLRWATEAGLDVGVIGSGSNLLVADTGVLGLVIKLDAALAKIEHRDGHFVCGGGARLPQASARAAALGLGGLEFGVNIPGTVGGAVKMNANAYGGELQRVLEWVDVSTAAGTDRRRPEQLGFAYRSSNLSPGEVVARASFELQPAESGAVKDVLADMRARRKEAQPSGIKTFGSTFKNPDHPGAPGMTAGQLLEAAGCGGLQVGEARFSPKHANFVENRGRATTADVLALMGEGRRKVWERFRIQLEPEVQLLGDVKVPGETPDAARPAERDEDRAGAGGSRE
jgi:UDP-N-acetylenolpyruvoylglucosamine reductase